MIPAPEWCATLPGISGAMTLDAAALERWPDRALDDRLHHLQFCPVVLNEIYQIVRFLPLLVLEGDAGPEVMADLRPQSLRRPAFDANGQLQLGYRPMSTRLLPFISRPNGQVLRLIQTEGPTGPERPEELRQQVRQMLMVQLAGYQRLQSAARLLIARGYLVPAAPPENAQTGSGSAAETLLSGREYQPAPDMPDTDRPDAGIDAEAGPDGPLALRLLAAIEFSQVHRRQPYRSRQPMDRLRDRLGRDDVLRQALFIDGGDVIDFSGLHIEATD